MSHFLQYDGNGRIMLCGFVSDEHIPAGALTADAQFGDITSLQNSFYINNGEITERPDSLVTIDKQSLNADGLDVITINSPIRGVFTAKQVTDIPDRLNPNLNIITGSINGLDTFSTTIAGTYKITIESFPCLDFETIITGV